MTSILETQVAELLTTALGRAPTAAELSNGIISPWTLAQTHNTLNPGDSTLSVAPTESIQDAIDKMVLNGGGIVNLQAGTFTLAADITLYDNIVLQGAGSGSTILDFNNTAYGVKIVGTNGYETGSVTISNGDTTVVGTGTTWTSAMVGRSIMLQDFWYPVVGFTNTTHITIAYPYFGTNIATARYAIANIKSNTKVNYLTIKNSTSSLFKMKYVNNTAYYDVTCDNGDVGFDHQWVANVNSLLLLAQNCPTYGWRFNDTAFGMWIGLNAVGCGIGVIASYLNNSAIAIFAMQSCTTIGFSLSHVNNCGFVNFSISNNGSHGIELVTDNEVGFNNGLLLANGGDGYKATDTSSGCEIIGVNVSHNGGWGVNIANANCTNDSIIGCYVHDNSSGQVTNSGTGTVLAGNTPASLNGASGSFTSADAKTVTVVGGQISAIT